MATERDDIAARGSERLWTSDRIFKRWQRFREQKITGKALRRIEFTEHIAFLLFLKLDHERAQRTGTFARPAVAPAGAWPQLVDASGDALHRALGRLMADLGAPNPTDPRRTTASVVFQDAQPWNVDRMAELGRLITEEFNPYRWSNVPRDELGGAFALLLADCRDDLRTKRDTGQFLTPPPLLAVVAKALGLTPGDKVVDAAVGIGTSLIAAYREMAAHGERVDASAIAGADIDVQMCRLATMNVLLNTGRPFHDVPPILRADSLKAREDVVRRHERSVDATVVICNPPFKSDVAADTQQRDDFWAQNAILPANFLQHLAITLPRGARAAVFVPDGVLSHDSRAAAAIRRALLMNCNVHTLLRLPTGMFYDTGSKSNILFFTKSADPQRPGDIATRELGVFDLRDRHYTDTRNPLAEADFEEFLTTYRLRAEGQPVESEPQCFRRYDVGEILRTPTAGLALNGRAATLLDDHGDPRDIAKSIVRHLGEAQKSFQAVVDSLN
ncbi:SAM-dependent methyltransferase [Streptomyces kunmingensis]|uniref:site-specific DNA-methyltransferase (adenine-specific) n=1 Tax=Streptomyces kunmingensis TaxID=68225 RepID=A0ABU6CIT2_9ACTN|nr:N-6 DNA methylase [Streptomyces kunmingensis]MEB3964646.1 SAM-dependent methyltransferase [Streptomyces kunmingensis]